MELTTNEIISSFDKEWTGYFGWGLVSYWGQVGGSELIVTVRILSETLHRRIQL